MVRVNKGRRVYGQGARGPVSHVEGGEGSGQDVKEGIHHVELDSVWLTIRRRWIG